MQPSKTTCATATSTSKMATGRRPPPHTTARSTRRPVRSPPKRTASAPRSSSSSKTTRAASHFIDKAKSRYPNAAEVMEQEALILWESGSQDDAIKVAEKVVKSRPQTFTNQKLIGEYYFGARPGEDRGRVRGVPRESAGRLEKAATCCRASAWASRTSRTHARCSATATSRAPSSSTARRRTSSSSSQRKLGKKPNAMVNAGERSVRRVRRACRAGTKRSACASASIQDPRRIDTSGSVWFNLATAYLARKQTKKARSAGNEFSRLRKNEARGYMLIGDTFFEDRDWTSALDQYLRAEKLLRPNQAREQVSCRSGSARPIAACRPLRAARTPTSRSRSRSSRPR